MDSKAEQKRRVDWWFEALGHMWAYFEDVGLDVSRCVPADRALQLDMLRLTLRHSDFREERIGMKYQRKRVPRNPLIVLAPGMDKDTPGSLVEWPRSPAGWFDVLHDVLVQYGTVSDAQALVNYWVPLHDSPLSGNLIAFYNKLVYERVSDPYIEQALTRVLERVVVRQDSWIYKFSPAYQQA